MLIQKLNEQPWLWDLERAKCAQDCRHWINTWCWTYDPRAESSDIPMILFPKQEDLLDFADYLLLMKRSGIGDKSRDMGFTWVMSLWITHKWLFRKGFKAGIGSRKEKLVDTIGDMDSIFEKIRYNLRKQPWQLMPRAFDWGKHDNSMKLLNPDMGSAITGEAGENIGRGGRNTFYLVDESGFLERPKQTDAALSNNTDSRFDISTPNGLGNPFAEKRHSGNFPVFSMHWKEDPRKNGWAIVHKDNWNPVDPETNEEWMLRSGLFGEEPDAAEIPKGYKLAYPWYEKKKIDLNNDPVIIAQELDIDYAASIEGITIPLVWVRSAIDLWKHLNIPISDNVVAAMDVANDGGAKNVFMVKKGIIVSFIEHWHQGTPNQSGHKAIQYCNERGVRHFKFDHMPSGVAGVLMEQSKYVKFGWTAVNVGLPASFRVWEDKKTAREKFVNQKAELWWRVRERFRKTYEMMTGQRDYPIDELISIPDHKELIAQLSNVLHFYKENGKIMIETKEQLSKRGIASPDFADTLVLLEADERPQQQQMMGQTYETM